MKLSEQPRESLKVLDAEYTTESQGNRLSEPIVHLMCRDDEGTKRWVEVEGFRPYFYISMAEFGERLDEVINDRHVVGIEGDFDGALFDGDELARWLAEHGQCQVYNEPSTFESLDDESLVKLYTIEPGHVGKIREYFDETWEADVPFHRRFLISAGITNGVEVPVDQERVRYENWQGHSDSSGLVQELSPTEPPEIDPRVMFLDIEVETQGDGLPDPARGSKPITAITAYDNYDEQYAVWALEHEEWDDPSFDDPIEDRLDIDADVRIFEHEGVMLENLHQWVNSRDFDIMSAWNAKFDYPYLVNRSYEVSAYSVREYARFGNPGAWRDDRDQIQAKMDGRIVWDALQAYEKTQFRDLQSYRLEYVAQKELGMGKEDIENLDWAWKQRPIDFVVYNVRDVQAVVQIEQEARLLELFDNLRQLTGAGYTTCYHNGPMLDTLFLHKAFEEGVSLPTNTPVPAEEGKYHGAKVFDPEPGVHDNCVYPDLSSMYPNLFSMLNLGKETIIGAKEDFIESEYTEEDVYRFPVDMREFATVPKGESYDNIDREQYKGVLSEDGGVREMFDPQYDDMYVLKPDVKESFIRSTIDDLIDLKNEYSGARYGAVKRVTNSCFTSDTDVLTPDGIVNIRDVSIGDDVYSWNPETGSMEIKPVIETIEKPNYDGKLVHIDNQMLDLKVTPDHRLYTKRSRRSDEWEITEAGNLNEWTHYETPNSWNFDHGDGIEEIDIATYLDDEYTVTEDTVSAGHSHNTFPRYYDGDDFIELLGWFIAEGYSETYDHAGRGDIVEISQYKEENREHHDRIDDLLDRMNIRYSSKETHFNICGSVFEDVLSNLAGDCSAAKKIPDLVFDRASKDQKELLLRTLMNGDGDARESPKRYSTKSDELRDDFIRLCWELGHKPTYTYGDGGEYNTGVWRIHWTRDSDDNSNMSFRMHRDGSTETADNGVYCVQVADNHTLVAGRNGKFSNIMNCYGVAGDSASGGKGFRLFNRLVAEGITMAGRLTIEHTAQEFTQYIRDNYDEDAYLVGGDTDSSVSSLPNAPTLGHVKEWSEDAIEHVEMTYDGFVDEQFDMPADDHRLAVELESVASDLFYMEDDEDTTYRLNDSGMLVHEDEGAVKKRYAQHIVWDDDDGWFDLPDADETEYDVLSDPDSRSVVADLPDVTHDEYSSVLSEYEAADNVEITGFEYVRSDTATITKEAQLRVLTDVLLADDDGQRIRDYVSSLRDDVIDGTVPAAKLGRAKGISKSLDEYGWKTVEELEQDSNYTVREDDRQNGGRYVAKAGPTYRGRKYAVDHFDWEDGDQVKCTRLYIERVRNDEYPAAYEYDEFPRDDRPDPLEVGDPVDAITVEEVNRIPDGFVVDREKMMEKECKDKLQPILTTVGEDWDDIVGTGEQTGLDAFA